MNKATIELLKELTEMGGVPGFESEVREFIRRRLKGKAEFQTDNLGSLICKKAGKNPSPRIMVPAHMDEIGFMVKDIDETGVIRFVPLGGWLDHTLLAQRVVIKTSKGDVEGTFGCTPPHMMPPDERKKLIPQKKMFIDVGAEDKKHAEEKLGIRIGNPVVPQQKFSQLKNRNRLLAKAWDDRFGCAVAIQLVEKLQRVAHPNTVYAVGTVQEEVGARGADTAADVVNPDFCMNLDVGLATDMPGIENEGKVSLGKGPIFYVADAGTIASHQFNEFVISVAKKNKIPYQLSVLLGGSTDARVIQLHGRGVPSVNIALPARYIHSHSGIIDVRDYDATLTLVLEVVKALNPQQAKQLVD